MGIIAKMRRQRAILWERAPGYDAEGRPAYLWPVEIACRWDDENREERDARGQLFVTRAVVYVDRVLKLGDVLKKGALDSTTPAIPDGIEGAYPIRAFRETPDFKARNFLYTALL